jgi:hypothetical protein
LLEEKLSAALREEEGLCSELDWQTPKP